MSQLRREVLAIFKKLHRTKQKVFFEDVSGLIFVRGQINDRFKENKHIDDPAKIKELIQFGSECEEELRTNVIQAVEKSDNHYALRITEDTLKLDNVPFNENAVIEPPRKGNKRCK